MPERMTCVVPPYSINVSTSRPALSIAGIARGSVFWPGARMIGGVYPQGHGRPQSHFGAKPKSVSRPLALPIGKSGAFPSSDSAKSKMSIFSDSRSIREVRGIAETFCCTSQRRQTCAAVLPWACPIRGQRLVVLDPALGDRTIGDHRHAVARAGLLHLGLVEIGMVFDLVAHQRLRTGRDGLLDQGHGEIRNADVPRQAELLDMRQRAQRLRQRHPRIGPVQQQQIDFGQAAAWSGSPWWNVRDRSARNAWSRPWWSRTIRRA